MDTTITIWLALALGVFPLLFSRWNEIWYVWRHKVAGAKLPSGHMGIPLFGELPNFLWYFKVLRQPDEFINSKRRKYGDGVGMYKTHLFGSPAIISWDSSVNKFVYQNSDVFIAQWPTYKIYGDNSLASLQGESHARLRTYVSNAVNRPDALRSIAQIVQPRIVASLQKWAKKGQINARNETKKASFENIGKMFANLEPGPILDTVGQLFDGLLKGARSNPINFPGTAYHNALRCRRKLLSIFMVELERKKNGEVETRNDLMDGLMQMKDEEGNKLGDAEVLDNIVSLVVGGYESTAISSMWALYYLAKYPNVLNKLREENISISKSKEGDYITSEDVSKMKYTNMVVKETIRLTNVSAFIFRKATRDIEYKGYKIPKGWRVILWLRYLHTNPENFDDPMCFNPERWNESVKPGMFQAFGGGPRMCAGSMLAQLQLAIFIHHLSIGYKWELINPNANIVYLPHPKPEDGLELSFTKIQNNHV